MVSDFQKRNIEQPSHEFERPTTAAPSAAQEVPGRPAPRRKTRKKFSCFFIVIIIVLTMVTAVLAGGNNSFLAGIKNGYLIRQITNILSSKEKELQGEQDDRIDFILLGMGGPGHEGPYLTDTIIIASFKPSTNQAALISLPRDMIVQYKRGDYRKINSIFSIGQTSDEQNGGQLAKEVIGNTLDIDIDYFGAVDFTGFVEIIDELDGIEVTVDKEFTDNQFPTADYKTTAVHFDAGEQTMDGLTALRFARSRHGNNGEGSDFARIKRQQKILLALKNKATSFNTLINPQKITNIFSLFNKYTSTDMEPWEAVKLVHLSKSLDTQRIITKSIDDRPGGYLKAGIAPDGAYILQPVTGDFEQIQLLVKNIFDIQDVVDENAKIVVQNGTPVPGLALKAVNHLSQMDYNVIRYGNAANQDKITTVIYNYNEDKPQTKKALESIFQTKAIATNIPLEYQSATVATNWGITEADGQLTNIDFLIVLGADQDGSEEKQIIVTIDPSVWNASTTTSTEEITE